MNLGLGGKVALVTAARATSVARSR